MSPRILFAVGGTGGHVFPALALAEDLLQRRNYGILFAGGKLSKNPYFEPERFPYREVMCGQLKLAPWKFFQESYRLIKGVRESLKIIREFDPDLVIGFGSYYALPVLIAAKILQKPIFLHESNSIPGRVNRLLAPFVEGTCVQFPSAKKLLRGHVTLGTTPLRANFCKGIKSREEARKAFQLAPDLTTLLIFGGSQGSKRINELFSSAAIFHLKEMLPSFQLLHFTGNHQDAVMLMERYVRGEVTAYVRPFEKRMDLAWAAADMAVTRSGAASIAEQIEFEVPGILIPFPGATDQHQDKNADFLVETGLAAKLIEADLTPQLLAAKIHEMFLLKEESIRRFQEYKNQYFAPPLAEIVTEWINRYASPRK